MEEVWKDILGFIGYQISDQGRVRSCRYGHKYGFKLGEYRLITPNITSKKIGNQYLYIDLIDVSMKRKSYALHRLLYEIFIGPIPEKHCVDHVDRNSLNNCLDNLRCTTRSLNNVNQRKRKGMLYKGVRKTRDGKWEARSSFNKKTVYLGRYSTPEEAAKVYNEYAIKSFGEFAVINILPDEVN